MRRLPGLLAAATAALAVLGASASAAGAQTFYVNFSTGSNAFACTEPGAPCKTINAAVEKSESSIEAARIEVAAGVYEEAVVLGSSSDAGIAINGAGQSTEIVGPPGGSSPAVGMSAQVGVASLSNLRIINQSGNTGAGVATQAMVAIENVSLLIHNAKANGIEALRPGSVAMKGSEVTMAGGTESGWAVNARGAAVSAEGSRLNVVTGSKAGGLSAIPAAGVSLTGSAIVDSGEGSMAAFESEGGPIALSSTSITQNDSSSAPGLAMLDPSSASISNVRIEMAKPANTADAIVQALGTVAFEHLEVNGAWSGAAFFSEGAADTFRDSRLIEAPASKTAAFVYVGLGEVPGPVLTRTVVQTGPKATQAIAAVGGNLTLDSSEVLGGETGVVFDHTGGKTRRLTVSASTIDAGETGVADPVGVHDLTFLATGTGAEALGTVTGSILLEPQISVVGGASDHAHLACAYSDVPSQTQAEKGGEGSIECASGSTGNVAPTVAELFAFPATAYMPGSTSPAVDSVPSAAISLPVGLTPSATDFAGNPRVVDGNGDCVALQDRGALELQGHSAPCPPAPAPPVPPVVVPASTKPPAPAITALTVSPASFAAAPSGATISAKKSYGAKIAYRDSQAATATLTVLREEEGRKQGKSCRKPGKANKHGKRCTILTRIGTFTHADTAGSNSFHFSGRIHAKKLAKGPYRLQATAANTNGRSITATTGFKVR